MPESDHHFLGERDAGDVRRFIDAIKGNRMEALYVLALALGLRQGELLGLRWEDIDLEASVCPITFGDTKEGAMGIRINDQIRTDKGNTYKDTRGTSVNVPGLGKLQNAEGKVGEGASFYFSLPK